MSGAAALSPADNPVRYRPEPADWERLRAAVEAAAPVRTEPVRRSETYLDTLDWRLHRRGLRLAIAPLAGGPAEGFVARLMGAGALPIGAALPDVPGLAEELPAGRLRERLAPAIGIRRLLPLVTIETEGQVLKVLDRHGKTTARVLCARRRARVPDGALAPGGAPGPGAVALPAVVLLEPVLGYPGVAARISELIGDALAGGPAAGEPFVEALAAIGRRPGDYASRPEPRFPAGVEAGEAVRQLLAALLEVVRCNEQGVARALDVEFLHDFRVALRRSRSLLGQTERVLGAPGFPAFREELRWLGRLSGPVRDLDVWRLDLERLGREPDGALGDRLAPVRRFAERRHALAQARLAEGLASDRYRRFVEGWRGWIDSPAFARGPDAGRPAHEAASRIIRTAARKVRRRGRALGDDAPSAVLHRLRIEGKKLRYALEHFGPLYREEAIRPFVAAQKKLQDRLGTFNDLTVQIAELEAAAERLGAEAGPPTLVAIGRLIERLSAQRERARDRAARAFASFDARAHKLRSVLRP